MQHDDPRSSAPGLLSGEQVIPLDLDAVRTVRVGTALWLVAFLVLLPFTDGLSDSDRGWWLWTCVAGMTLGLIGIAFTTRRRQRMRAQRR